jgi:hypothetical protein
VYHRKKWLVTRKRVLFEQPLCAVDGCTQLSQRSITSFPSRREEQSSSAPTSKDCVRSTIRGSLRGKAGYRMWCSLLPSCVGA